MRRTDLAKLTPALVTWAIDRSHLTREQISEKIKVPLATIATWEAGEADPLFTKAVEFAKAVRVPFGYFYLDQPPTEDIPLPDLRTLDGKPVEVLSTNFRDALYLVLSQHDWYKDFARENGVTPPPFVGRYTKRDDIKTVAADIRQTVSINRAARAGCERWTQYLGVLSANAEAVGIIVMRRGFVGGDTHRSLSREEFQGFAISDPIAPLIFINGADYATAKVFTLAHELAHLWLGITGISKIEEVPDDEPQPDIERLCDSIAAEVLVPEDEFLRVWRGIGGYAEVENLARTFFVSTLVILRRARELNLLPFESFIQFVAIAKSKVTPKKSGGSAGVRKSLDSRNGQVLVDALISDVKRGGTTYLDGASLMGTSVPTFINVVEGKYTV